MNKKINRPALVEIDKIRRKKKRKLEKQKAERRRYLVSVYTRERLCVFFQNVYLFIYIKEEKDVISNCNYLSNRDHWHVGYL